MNKQEAKNLIVNTFEKPFNEAQFSYFIKNLLNNLDESKQKEYRGQYIPESFSDAVKHYKRIGQFVDSKNNVIDVLIVNLNRGTSLERARSLQRNFIARYLKQRTHDAALVAYYTDGNNDWRFSLVKMDINLIDKKIETDFSPARRYSFLVGTNEGSHTAQNQFVKLLTEKEENPTLDKIEDAFNIETVTKEFFLKYRELFIHIKQSLDKVIKNDPTIEAEFKTKEINSVDFAKKLLGQIVFLYFLQKKGWFGVEKNSKWGSGSKKFLREIFEKKHGNYDNFFNDILEPLFYEALRNDRTHDDHYYSRFNCKIPFLNGGLFDPIGNYDWSKTDIILPNDLFSNTHQTKEGDTGVGILDVFDRYNFTVIEDEPLEKEVAIDPELLGKTYEKFNAIRPDNFDEYLKALKGGKKGDEAKFNKQYGVFYTPREIVHFMCQQSLINYLTAELVGKVSKESIEFLILEGEKVVEHLRTAKEKSENNEDYTGKYKENNHFLELKENANEINNLLANVKMCDPAVGSGAFPVGMMTEIVKARMFFVLTNCLADKYINPHNQKVKRNPYNFKRDCIENSLYGVDIDSGAVEIAKLRLWLSLVVDEDDITNIKPLPNLDYKIVCGNSLLGFPENWKSSISDKIEFLKNEYFTETRPQRKKELKQDIDSQIKSRLVNSEKNFGYAINFDFKTFFSEVFHEKNGFDIVIANPPYIQLQKNKMLSLIYEKSNYQTFFRSGDIYCLFFEKGTQILKQKGILTFVTSNTWLQSLLFTSIRKYLIQNFIWHDVLMLPTKVFNAVVDTAIFIFTRKSSDELLDRVIRINEYKNHKIVFSHFVNHNALSLSGDIINLTYDETQMKIVNKIYSNSCPIIDKFDFYNGVKPYEIGKGKPPQSKKVANEKPFTKEGPKPDHKWQPLLRGSLIGRYLNLWENNYWVLYGKWLAAPRDPEIFRAQEKIVVRQTGDSLIATKINNNFIARDNLHIIIPKQNYNSVNFLLGLLNSKLYDFIYSFINPEKGEALAQVKLAHLEQMPFPQNELSKREQIEQIVNKIIISKQKGIDTTVLESEIDILVYKLYNLTYEEVEIIDPEIEQIISKEEYEKYELSE